MSRFQKIVSRISGTPDAMSPPFLPGAIVKGKEFTNTVHLNGALFMILPREPGQNHKYLPVKPLNSCNIESDKIILILPKNAELIRPAYPTPTPSPNTSPTRSMGRTAAAAGSSIAAALSTFIQPKQTSPPRNPTKQEQSTRDKLPSSKSLPPASFQKAMSRSDVYHNRIFQEWFYFLLHTGTTDQGI
eukprot:m.126958 g.126958  ORF g.126958 m.126958 type:complete len:188 (-) comp14533_c0_seq4:1385-1948(-)